MAAPRHSGVTSLGWRKSRITRKLYQASSRGGTLGHQNLRLALDHQGVADMGRGGKGAAALVPVEIRDGDTGAHGIADPDRRLEFQALAQIDAPRPRQLGAQNGGDK